MTHQIRRVGMVFGFLILALMINLNLQQVLFASDIKNRPGNSRELLQEYDRERGPILLGTEPIARSVPTEGSLKYLRRYSDGPLYVPATGYYSIVYGATGLERAENPILAGTGDQFFVNRLQQLVAGRDVKGGAVTVTLNAAAQQAAANGLAGQVGSVTAIEPQTGNILALVQAPSFDPNTLSSHDTQAITDYYAQLEADPEQPLLNRPLVSTKPPGSTFKLVTAAAALAEGYAPDTTLPAPAAFPLPGSTKKLRNWQGAACGPNDETTLANALTVSCNSAFAFLGVKLGDDALRAQAQKFGFDTAFDVPLKAAISRFPANPDPAQTAMSAIGQFDVTATTLQMAMVGASIGNGGVTMRPQLVKDLRGADLQVISTSRPSEYARAMSPENAQALLEMMESVVSQGTGTNAGLPGVRVAGKTGTAETAPGRTSIAWFVAVAPVDDPKIAVAVCVENAQGSTETSGNQTAAPIARAVMEAYLSQQGSQ